MGLFFFKTILDAVCPKQCRSRSTTPILTYLFSCMLPPAKGRQKGDLRWLKVMEKHEGYDDNALFPGVLCSD